MQATKGDSNFMGKGRTLPCRICGEPYTDRFDPAVDPARGGYVICPLCAMRPDEAKEIVIDPDKLVDAIKNKGLTRFRKSLGLTQDDLAEKLGITPRHLRRIEDSTYIPNGKVIRKIEIVLKNVRYA